jgi:2,4-dienoyl-CoA reductase-like NADH-dependent reductase (Old Yellow Enzyme family)
MAVLCGFDAVQLHLAYGWLLYRFLDPSSNHRTDAYGNQETVRKLTASSVTDVTEPMGNGIVLRMKKGAIKYEEGKNHRIKMCVASRSGGSIRFSRAWSVYLQQ